jgi:hypothetical protein
MNTVKFGDTHTVTFTVKDSAGVPVDLSGATIRVLAVLDGDADQTTIVLASALGGGTGEVTHTLTGTLPVGTYSIEVEVTQGGTVISAPSAGYATLQVVAGLG